MSRVFSFLMETLDSEDFDNYAAGYIGKTITLKIDDI